jgi:hypothetical protein
MRSDPLRGKVKNGSPLDDAKGVVKDSAQDLLSRNLKRRMLMMLFISNILCQDIQLYFRKEKSAHAAAIASCIVYNLRICSGQRLNSYDNP